MRFEINNRNWIIKEVSQQELQTELNDFNGEGNYYGLTLPDIQEIWLWKDVKEVQKKKTLYHELMHCYLFSYVSFNNINFSIDDFCDISANSHDTIHKIVEDYFKGEKIDN